MAVSGTILEEIRESPDFKEYVEALRESLRREEKRRQQFRASLDEDVRAEFINGRVVKQVPAKDQHTVIVANLGTLASTHAKVKKLGAVRCEQALVAFPRNDYGPDICFWKKATSKHFGPDQLIYSIPDFICEVLSPSTANTDRKVKFRDYESNGVREYWIVDPVLEVIEQYLLVGERYKLIGSFKDGVIRSHSTRSFKIPVRAVFDEDECLATLKRLIAG